MNIVEAYIKFKKQLLIFISGLPGCGKMELAKNISADFNIEIIDQFNYYKKDYSVTTTLPDGTELINWYTDDAIDWDKFNKNINEMKEKGLIVVGISFPSDKIEATPDHHIHLNISKQLCMEKRTEFLNKHKDEEKYKEDLELIGTQTEKLKMNQLIFPYYLEAIKNAKINKFININELNENQTYDIAFDLLLDMIKKYLKQDQYSETSSEQTTETIQSTTDSENSHTPKVSRITKLNTNYKKPNNKKKQKTNKGGKDETMTIHAEMLSEPRNTYEYQTNESLDMIEKLTDPEEFSEDEGPIYFIYPNTDA